MTVSGKHGKWKRQRVLKENMMKQNVIIAHQEGVWS